MWMPFSFSRRVRSLLRCRTQHGNAHARPEDGVNRLSLAITVIQQGVHFNSEGNDPVKMLVTLAATDSESHVGAIAQLAELFMNEEHVEQICNAQTIEDVLCGHQKLLTPVYPLLIYKKTKGTE